MTAEYIRKQASRLMRLPFPPVEEHDRKALLGEFTKLAELHCADEEHLTAVIDHLIATAQRCPAPAALADAAQEIIPVSAKQPFGCDKCHGSGWYHFEQMVNPPGVDPYMAEYCTFCSCEAGQWKKAKAKAYEAKEAAKNR